MFKPLTLSLGLAVALGTCSLSVAGLHDKPSAQDPMPSGQVMPSEQGGAGCDLLGPVKKHSSLFDIFKHKPKCYTYEWVLKKKRVRHGLFGLGDCGSSGGSAGCGDAVGCDMCGETIYPSGQGPSAQSAAPQGGYAAPQGGYAAPQYGAPEYGATQMLGSGQITAESVLAPAAAGVAAPAAVVAPVDPAMEPPPAPRELGLPEAPAVPSVPEVPAVPDAPIPAAPSANAGGLLYLPSAG